MSWYIYFKLILNTCLYNIIFINNLYPHLKNSGSLLPDFDFFWVLNSCCRKDRRRFYESPRIARVHWLAQGNEAK
jgi:hypothetical protein